MSSSEKPEFCFPTRRGSRTFWVARRQVSRRAYARGAEQESSRQGPKYLGLVLRRPLGATRGGYGRVPSHGRHEV